MKIVLLASGAGSLAQAIFSARATGQLDCDISLLISDQDAPVLAKAESAAVPTKFLPMLADRDEWNRQLFEIVKGQNPDLVVSVGFMRILAPDFVSHFRVINTHPALLPNYPGAHAVRDALADGATVSGATVHWVDAGVDTGEVISQREVPVLDGDDEASLHERIKIAERTLIVETLQHFATHRIPGAH